MEVKLPFTPQLILQFKYHPLQKAIRATEKLLVIISTEKYKFSEVKYTHSRARAYPNFDKGVVGSASSAPCDLGSIPSAGKTIWC